PQLHGVFVNLQRVCAVFQRVRNACRFKPKKLPAKTASISYALEYGTDALEIHEDAVKPGQRVIICDDLLATGGTAAATCKLVQKLGGTVEGAAFAVELTFLGGRKKLDGLDVFSLIHYDS